MRIVHVLTLEQALGDHGFPGKVKTKYVNKPLKDLRDWMGLAILEDQSGIMFEIHHSV